MRQFVLVLLLCILSPIATIAAEQGDLRLELGLGPNYPRFDAVQDELKSDVGFGVSVDYYYSKNWFGHAALDYFEFDGPPKMLSFLVGAGYDFGVFAEKWSPYFVFGIGGSSVSNFPSNIDDQTAFSFNLRPGVHYALNPNWQLGLSYEFVSVVLDGASDSAQVGLPFISIAWMTNVPTQAKTVAEEPTPEPAHVRPVSNKDEDEDGVLDRFDKCLHTAPGKLVDENGCEEPEDKDSDKDGVADSYDQCPGTPKGTKVNGFGCRAEEKIEMRLVINFDTDSAVIHSQYFHQLNRVAALMKRNSSAKLLIEGHTDSQGSDAHNLKLSNARSNSVREYLVKGGLVKSNRVSSRGFGESKPVATNNTAAGRLKNRRILATFYY